MDHQEIFSESVQKHFAFLIEEFGFSIVENQYHRSSAACIVAFQNKTRHVKLTWDLKDKEFYFGVYRVLSNGEPAPYQDHGTNPFYISTLVKYHEPHMDMRLIEEMDPYHPDLPRILDEKISANAQLLRKYGKDILSGHQWYDRIQKKLIPETTLIDGLHTSASEKVSEPLTITHPELQAADREANLIFEEINKKAANNVPTSDSRSTTTGQPIDSNRTLPMWVWLLIVGGISLCIGTALIFAFWSLLR